MLGKNPDIKDSEKYSFVGQTVIDQIAEFLYIFRNMSIRRDIYAQRDACVCLKDRQCFLLRIMPHKVPSNAVLN